VTLAGVVFPARLPVQRAKSHVAPSVALRVASSPSFVEVLARDGQDRARGALLIDAASLDAIAS